MQTPEMAENKMGVMPEGRLVVTVSFPIMLSMLIQALYNIVDGIYVARLSEAALTAVSLAFPVQLLMIAVATGAGVGLTALLSRRLGQKKKAEVDAVAMNGLVLALACWGLFAVLGAALGGPFIDAFAANPSIAAQAKPYVSICTLASSGVFLLFFTERLMQATGNTVYHMITQLIGAGLNLILDPLLIFGLCGFPAMGTAGAALATVIAQNIAMLCGFAINLLRNREIGLSLRGFRPDGRVILSILRIGLPAMVIQSLMSILTICLNRLLISFSETAVGFYGAYYKLQNFLFMPVYGLNNALIPMVGYNFGAGLYPRIGRIVRRAIGLSLVIMAAGTLLFLLAPGPLLSLFDASADMRAIGIPAIRIISSSFCLAGVSVVLCGCMQGLGHSMPALVISLLRQLVLIVPLAFFFGKIGLIWLWLAFPIAEAVAFVCAIFLWRRIVRRTLSSAAKFT